MIYQQNSKIFRLLSHPVRLQILDELRRGEACVCHLQTLLHKPQAYVSQQLLSLREAGVVDSTKDGLNVYYRVSDPLVIRILEEVLGDAGEQVSLPGCPCPKCNRGCCSE